MARQTDYSVTALATAASGEKLPSLAVALAYARACGGDAVQWEERWRETKREEDAQVSTPQEDSAAAPYRGMMRFEARDADVFFGRSRLTDDLVQLARAHRVTAVFGPSGSGKSSLLRAGLIPRLQEVQDLPLRPAAIRILTPGARSMHTDALEELFVPAEGSGETWLIVDQFEELFTLHPAPEEQAAFISLLLSAQDADSRLRVVLGVRADFYGRCLEHEGLAEVIRQASLPVGPMTAMELREAIVKPATSAGLIVERVLTDRLIAEVREEPGGLPLLSHALLETWRRRRGRALTLHAYEAAGGIHGAIAQTAEDLYTQLTESQADSARRILLRLITPGDGAPDTRRPVDQAELDTAGPAHRGTQTALGALARARLITLDETSVDLAHEALITAWPRLHRWIEDSRERLRRHRRLTQAARHWHDRGCDSGSLLRGTELTEAEEAFQSPDHQGDLTAAERDFLRAGAAARDRGRRRRHAVIGAVSLLVTLALVAGAVAWQQSRSSDQRRREAAARRVAAVAESMRFSDPATAMRLSTASWALSETTETRAALLGALSQQEQDAYKVPGAGPMARAYLSADGRTVVMSGEHSVRAWNASGHRPASPAVRLAGGPTEAVSPDGHTLLRSSGDRVRLWDLRRGEPLGAPFGEAGALYTFGASGRTVVSEGETDGDITLWDMEHRRTLFEQHGVFQWALSPDDRLLALCTGEKDPIQVWNISEHRQLPQFWSGSRGPGPCGERALKFTPDSRGLMTESTDELRLWDLDKHQDQTRIRHKGLEETVFSPDGEFIAASDGREILLWRTAGPRAPVFRAPLTNEIASELRFDAKAAAIRYLSEVGSNEVSVRALSYRAALTDSWNKQPAAQGGFSRNGRVAALERRSGDTSRFEVRRTAGGKQISRTPGLRCKELSSLTGDTCYTALAISPDGHTLAYGRAVIDNDGTPKHGPITLWNVRENTKARSLIRPSSSGLEGAAMTGLSFTPDGRSLLIPRWDVSPTEIWDVSRGTRRKQGSARPLPDSNSPGGGGWAAKEWAGFSGRAPLAMRPDGRLVAVLGQTIALPSGQATANRLPVESISALAFSPDGKHLAAGAANGWVTLWDGEGKQPLGTLAGTNNTAYPGTDTEAVTALAYSPDGKTLAVAGDHGTLQMWDAASRQPLGDPLPTPGDEVVALTFSTDGRTLYTAGRHSAPRALAVDPERVTASICKRAHGGLSRADWHRYIPEVPYIDVC
ncbi:hypothetical protein ACFWPU_36535 [Streptomyces sp. NPDC058471]|uniref:nSTAND1 domain-containing NTPase n=1 Tax=Streptomyces sp. NPDC058471 TaxID=3346516 RepID=UPI00364CED59